MLSILIFLPWLAVLWCVFAPKASVAGFKYVNLFVSAVQLGLALILYAQFDKSLSGIFVQDEFHWVEKYAWIDLNLGSLGWLKINYFVGLDGLNLGLILLSSFVMLIASLSSWEIKKNERGYYSLLLILNSAIMGIFCSLDMFLFYIFYELMLLPLYFLIGIWGGERREYAAIKFFLYTLIGSVFMLLVMVGLYLSVVNPGTDVHSFDMLLMTNAENYIQGSIFDPMNGRLLLGYPARLVAFIALFVAFAIKIPIIPLHTWLPDAHVEAPTPVSILLAGVLLKIGGYGIVRICYGIFPEAALYLSSIIGGIGVVSIIYAAFNALAAKDLKRMIAYSSISHMGFVLLGIASLTVEGVSGAMFQMVSHGVLSAMLFFLVGVVYNRVHNREIANFSGLYTHMPRYSVYVFIAFFASLGLPGFSAFIAEAFVLIGAFNSQSINHLLPQWQSITAIFGIFLGACYFLWTLQRMFFGKVRFKQENWLNKLTDITTREEAILLPMAALSLILGVLPFLFLSICNQSVIALVEHTLVEGSTYLDSLTQFFD